MADIKNILAETHKQFLRSTNITEQKSTPYDVFHRHKLQV